MAGLVLEGRYRVNRLIARGGTSSVYLGSDRRLDRDVAIKIMDPQLNRDRRFVERFELEARSAAKLHHPHVVAVHDQGVHTGLSDRGERTEYVYLVMEFVTGGTLRDLLDERGALGPALALSVADPVLAALGAAHVAGLVHRDIKPENVLIGSDGVVKVADFGLVRAVTGTTITTDNVILGTAAYLSPEQVATGDADTASDVYSTGVMLYEMLTGSVPYTADSAISVAYRHVNDDVPAPSTRAPNLPLAIDTLVADATSRDHARRPADATVLRRELHETRTALRLPAVAVPVPTLDRTETIPAVTDTGPPTGTATVAAGPRGTRMMAREAGEPAAPERETGTAKRSRRNGLNRRALALWLAVLLVLGAAGGTTAWWFGSGRWTEVPTVAGMTAGKAKQALRAVDLTANVTKAHDDSVPAGTVISSDPAAGEDTLHDADVTLLVSAGRPVVPDITAGMGLAKARTAITDADLKPEQGSRAYSTSVPDGKVVKVTPGPGSRLTVGAGVTIVLSKGPPPKPVPDVGGMSRDQAFAALRKAGMQPYEKGKRFSPDVERGTVIGTDPDAGSRLAAEDSHRVGVVLSNAVTVPMVVGHTVAEAKQALHKHHLEVEVHQFGHHANGRVLAQSESPGSDVKPGTTVTLTAFP